MFNFIRGFVFLDSLISRLAISHSFYTKSTDTIDDILYREKNEHQPIRKSTGWIKKHLWFSAETWEKGKRLVKYL